MTKAAALERRGLDHATSGLEAVLGGGGADVAGTAPMMTTAIKAAIRPYSMAVAPDWSFMKRVTNLDMSCLLFGSGKRKRVPSLSARLTP